MVTGGPFRRGLLLRLPLQGTCEIHAPVEFGLACLPPFGGVRKPPVVGGRIGLFLDPTVKLGLVADQSLVGDIDHGIAVLGGVREHQKIPAVVLESSDDGPQLVWCDARNSGGPTQAGGTVDPATLVRAWNRRLAAN